MTTLPPPPVNAETPRPLTDRTCRRLGGRRLWFYLFVLTVWIALLARFAGVLGRLVAAGDGALETVLFAYFAVFVCLAWLYGVYNIAVVVFARLTARLDRHRDPEAATAHELPDVAVLYTTCNDFSEAAAATCVEQDYPNFRVYLLDDSSSMEARRQVDAFARRHRDRVAVIRRPDREGFKAGNLNHALESVVDDPYFVVVDADERLPSDFLSRLVPRMTADPSVGFIQANHECLAEGGLLQRDMHVGVNVHWKWYQPLRNRFGFVMFLGHGAIIRRDAWVAAGGFPHIVSEDLAFAIEAREAGFQGRFAEDVVCYEEFPATVRDFRRRHVKWSRGTSEFLHHYAGRLVRSRRMSTAEKLDILFPTLNLPLTLFFFMFMIITGIALPLFSGEVDVLTAQTGLGAVNIPIFRLPEAFDTLHRLDLYLVTVATIASPVLSFVFALWRQPVRLVAFLVNSTALYSTLAPLTALAVMGYVFTRRATFIVTGDREHAGAVPAGSRPFWQTTDPDDPKVRRAEAGIAMVFVVGAVFTLQIALVGLGIGYLLMVHMHQVDWGSRSVRSLAVAPSAGIAASTIVGAGSLVGLQPVVFGLAMFHF